MNIFISVPMKGLTDQQISDEIELVCGIAKSYFPLTKLEFVCNFETEPEEPDENVKHESIWHLGEALKCLSTCDAIMCPDNNCFRNEYLNGCMCEESTALAYEIPIYNYDLKVLDEFLKGDFHDEHNTED